MEKREKQKIKLAKGMRSYQQKINSSLKYNFNSQDIYGPSDDQVTIYA